MARAGVVPVEVTAVTDHSDTAIDDREIPPRVADALRAALDLPEPPVTLGDWGDAAARLLEASDIEVGLEEMCTAESSRHAARVGGDVQHFHCVLDALLLPFVVDDQREFHVESRSPVSDEVVAVTVSRDDVAVEPASAVMSFGVSDDLELPDDGAVTSALAYEHACPYINAFPSRAEYERWADDTDAVTMAFPVTDGFALARRLEETPTYATE